MSKVNGNRIVAAAIGVALGAPVAQSAYAAEGALEEVVVTARKREENLQDVGAAVSALSATDLERRFDIDFSARHCIAWRGQAPDWAA